MRLPICVTPFDHGAWGGVATRLQYRSLEEGDGGTEDEGKLLLASMLFSSSNVVQSKVV